MVNKFQITVRQRDEIYHKIGKCANNLQMIYRWLFKL